LLAEQRKNSLGYSLIELIVVIAIVAVLTVALAFQYTGWQARYKVESQVKEVYSDLMTARIDAMQKGRVYWVTFGGGRTYQVYQATNDAGTSFAPAPGWTNPKTLDYPILWTSTVIMDPRGYISPLPSEDGTTVLRFGGWTTDNPPDYNCIVLSKIKISLGLSRNPADVWTTCDVK
jgi:prepilin-type N-terminal cleavage/methylation domain-containing protein